MFANLRGSLPFVAIWFATVVAQVLIVQFGGEFVKVMPLSALEWGVSIVIGLVSVPIGTVFTLSTCVSYFINLGVALVQVLSCV